MSSSKKINSNSKKKIISSSKKTNSNSKKKIISSSKKPIKSSIYSKIKYVVYLLVYTITTMITTTAFAYFYSNNFKIFVSLVISSLSLNYLHNKHIKTPTKVDSQKNIIKLPLSTFKFYVKKLVKMIEPLLSVMSSSLKLLAILFLINGIIEVSVQYYNSKEGMYKFLKGLFISDKNIKECLNKIPYKVFLKNNIPDIIKKYFPNTNMDNLDEVNKILKINREFIICVASQRFDKLNC